MVLETYPTVDGGMEAHTQFPKACSNEQSCEFKQLNSL